MEIGAQVGDGGDGDQRADRQFMIGSLAVKSRVTGCIRRQQGQVGAARDTRQYDPLRAHLVFAGVLFHPPDGLLHIA